MEQHVARPAPWLRSFVHRYRSFHYQGFTPTTHDALPSRHLTVMVSLADPIVVAGVAGGGSDRSHRSFVGGLQTGPVTVADQGCGSGVAIELTPRGARALFQVPAAAIAGQTVDLEVMWGPRADELAARLSAAVDWQTRVQVLDRLVGAAVGDPGEPHPAAGAAWAAVLRSGGTVRIGALADHIGLSRRHLSQCFRAEYGLSPKSAARVVRFERAQDLLEGDGARSLSQVAAACGFFDQAHLTQEWRALAGMTPTAWMAAELRDPPEAETVAGDGPGAGGSALPRTPRQAGPDPSS